MVAIVAHEITIPPPVEKIPDEDYLFLRVHQNDVDGEGRPTPAAFINRPKGSTGMSVDWAKYRTSTETRNRGAQAAINYAIVKFTARNVRAIPSQTVVHDPDNSNRAHSQVVGKKDTEVRERFMTFYEPEISLRD